MLKRRRLKVDKLKQKQWVNNSVLVLLCLTAVPLCAIFDVCVRSADILVKLGAVPWGVLQDYCEYLPSEWTSNARIERIRQYEALTGDKVDE